MQLVVVIAGLLLDSTSDWNYVCTLSECACVGECVFVSSGAAGLSLDSTSNPE